MIGRGPEREWLEQALADALSGRGSLVLLAGDAGVGKTRLAEEALESATPRFLRGAATSAGDAYGPIAAAPVGAASAVS